MSDKPSARDRDGRSETVHQIGSTPGSSAEREARRAKEAAGLCFWCQRSIIRIHDADDHCAKRGALREPRDESNEPTGKDCP